MKKKKFQLYSVAKTSILKTGRLCKKCVTLIPGGTKWLTQHNSSLLLEKITQHDCPAPGESVESCSYTDSTFFFLGITLSIRAKAHGSKIKLGTSVPKSKGWCANFELVIHSKILSQVYLRCWGDDRGLNLGEFLIL